MARVPSGLQRPLTQKAKIPWGWDVGQDTEPGSDLLASHSTWAPAKEGNNDHRHP